MRARTASHAQHKIGLLAPTVTKQCWGFMIGSACFALGSAPGLSNLLGSSANLLFFIGAWFFTGAGFMQLFLSGAVSTPVPYAPGRVLRLEWLTAATQSIGTLLFNVSTAAALYAKSAAEEDRLVWNPDAGGSVAFLISGVLACATYARAARLWDPGKVAWWSVCLNFAGCVAFGISALGSYALPDGHEWDAAVSHGGTFIGAVCFFLASLVLLPFWHRAWLSPSTKHRK